MLLEHKSLDVLNKRFADYIRVRGRYTWERTLRDEACFIYWINGNNQLYSNDGVIRAKGREALLLRCGNYIDQIDAAPTEEVEALIVHFFPELIDSLTPQELSSLKNVPGAIGTTKTHFLADEGLARYAADLLYYIRYPQLADEALMMLKMKELLILLSRSSQHQSLTILMQYLFSEEQRSFREVVERHVYSNLSTRQLAYLCHMSMSVFQREFKRIYGAAPAGYLRERKLERAKGLLATTDMRVSEIAMMCGFRELSQLSRSFRKSFGVSPMAYRKRSI